MSLMHFQKSSHQEKGIIVKTYKGYLIDLDGTMYRGEEAIESAAIFIDTLYEKDIPHLFLTNNSTATPIQVAEKLNRLGIKATPDHVFTSSMATAQYIKHLKSDARCYVIGETGLYEALHEAGLETVEEDECDYVVIGLDRQVTYDKFARACLAIRNGAQFISTNSDVAIPTEQGFLPGNGSLTSVITVSTGKEPIFIGKPEPIIMEEALAVLGTDKAETLMVGDNYDTDIKAGINAGMDTLLVYTGITSQDHYPSLKIKPTYTVQQLLEWVPRI